MNWLKITILSGDLFPTTEDCIALEVVGDSSLSLISRGGKPSLERIYIVASTTMSPFLEGSFFHSSRLSSFFHPESALSFRCVVDFLKG